MTHKKEDLEITVGIWENAGNQRETLTTSNLSSANAFNLDQSGILSFGKELECLIEY